MTGKAPRIDCSVTCAACGRERASCTIGGLHGAIRERAARAAEELRSPEWVRRARANTLPSKDLTRA